MLVTVNQYRQKKEESARGVEARMVVVHASWAHRNHIGEHRQAYALHTYAAVSRRRIGGFGG